MEFTDHKTDYYTKEEHPMKHADMHIHHHPVPPHLHNHSLSIQFDDTDWEIFKKVFADEDEASAAFNIILYKAPPEIKVLVAQLINQIKKEVA